MRHRGISAGADWFSIMNVSLFLFDAAEFAQVISDAAGSLGLSIVVGLLTGILSGVLVWLATDSYMRNREERETFYKEQQAMSRFLYELEIELDVPIEDFSLISLKKVAAKDPLRFSFASKHVECSSITEDLGDVLDEIENLANKKPDESYLKGLKGRISRIRIKICEIKWK